MTRGYITGQFTSSIGAWMGVRYLCAVEQPPSHGRAADARTIPRAVLLDVVLGELEDFVQAAVLDALELVHGPVRARRQEEAGDVAKLRRTRRDREQCVGVQPLGVRALPVAAALEHEASVGGRAACNYIGAVQFRVRG